MDLKLEDKTALVTGASSGIGRGIALSLAAEGVKLAIVARRGHLLAELADEIGRFQSDRPTLIVEDILKADTPARISAQAQSALGSIDILVNSAGGSRVLELSAADDRWEEGLTLNFTRQRQLSHAVLPGMMKRKWGRIINISGSSEPRKLNAANAAKAALHVWSKALSREVGRYGITVNCIGPGRIDSDQTRRNYTPDTRETFAQAEIPVGEFGEPADVAQLATFIASPLARYITGTVIPVDGGLRRYAF